MLTAAKKVQRREGAQFSVPVWDGVVIHKGALVVLNGSHAEPGSTALGLYGLGVAEESVDNSGGTLGAKSVPVLRGCFLFLNEPADPADRSHIGSPAYVVDDETVAATDGGGTRSGVGVIRDVDASGVWVEL